MRVADERLRAARRLAAADVDVVAVEGDVELAELELEAGALLDQAAQALRERDAARVDPDERDRVEILVALDDLVGDPRERAPDAFTVEQDPSGRHGMLLHRTPFRPLWAELKGRCGRDCTRPAGRLPSARGDDRGRGARAARAAARLGGDPPARAARRSRSGSAPAIGLAAITGRVVDWFVMTDELLYERLAISVAHLGSPLPHVRGELIPNGSQLYPLLIAPVFRHGLRARARSTTRTC